MKEIDYRRLPEQERLSFRKQAIRLINKGEKKGKVAELLCVRPETISQWCKRHNTDGVKGLVSKKKGVKSEDKKLLNYEQETAIQKMIVDKMPDQLKLNFALWIRRAVKELAEREYGIVLAITTMGAYLRK